MRLSFFAVTIGILMSIAPANVVANGGNIRIAEGKYLINISSAPITPIAGQEAAMLISFADVTTSEPLKQDITVWIEIRRAGSDAVVFPEQEFLAERGILDFDFTYREAGLHELFVRFEKPDEPGKIYAVEDFLIDVRKAEPKGAMANRPIMEMIAAAFIGFGIGFAVNAVSKTKKQHAQ